MCVPGVLTGRGGVGFSRSTTEVPLTGVKLDDPVTTDALSEALLVRSRCGEWVMPPDRCNTQVQTKHVTKGGTLKSSSQASEFLYSVNANTIVLTISIQ